MRGKVEQFIRDVSGPSDQAGSSYWNINTNFPDPRGFPVTSTVTLAASVDVSSLVPQFGLSVNVSDSGDQKFTWKIVNAAIAAGLVPDSDTAMYYLLPSGVTWSEQLSFCGWHTSVKRAALNMPALGLSLPRADYNYALQPNFQMSFNPTDSVGTSMAPGCTRLFGYPSANPNTPFAQWWNANNINDLWSTQLPQWVIDMGTLSTLARASRLQLLAPVSFSFLAACLALAGLARPAGARARRARDQP